MALPPSALTGKDVVDLEFGLGAGVDLVALSFVQAASDIAAARAVIDRAGRATPIVAKIERPAAVANLTEILDAAQGVMVARGDLGLEMKLEQLPRVQKEILRAARTHGKPAIVATQVLESMRVEPRPTRAEVSDAANAVDEGADAIMLSGETAAGAYPVRAVETLDAIIRDAESIPAPSMPSRAAYATGIRHTAALARSGGRAGDHRARRCHRRGDARGDDGAAALGDASGRPHPRGDAERGDCRHAGAALGRRALRHIGAEGGRHRSRAAQPPAAACQAR